MALSRESYRALKDAVGPENISEDAAVLDSYAYQWKAELFRPGQSKFMSRPEAVLLPGSTEEVQAIVRACNRYRIKYKAFSTGWGAWAAPSTDGVIQLDLRRMNRILEIDEKNMFAVIEPYVICGALQAEAMKVGLNCHITGAGASCSHLAMSTSFLGGHGPGTLYHGNGSQCLLALEWVMPTGDILRTSSLGSGDGWFCGEGPGPSLRGIVRGVRGASGGMGVFTRCAVKLFHWPGPAEMPVEGTVPAYRSPLPDNFRAHTVAFPSWEAYFDAYHKIWDSEIGYIAHRQFNMLGNELSATFFKAVYTDPTKTLGDLEELLKKPELQALTDEMRLAFQIVLAGNSPGDIKYQEMVLDKILAQTGGWKVAAMDEPAIEQFTLLYMIRLPFKNLNFVFAGGNQGTFTQPMTTDCVAQYAQVAMDVMKKHEGEGRLAQCGADTLMGPLAEMGGGGTCGLEQFCCYDPDDTESVQGMLEFVDDTGKTTREHGWPVGQEIRIYLSRLSKEQRHAYHASAAQPQVLEWQWKMKQMLDPNNTGGGQGYIVPEEPRR